MSVGAWHVNMFIVPVEVHIICIALRHALGPKKSAGSHNKDTPLADVYFHSITFYPQAVCRHAIPFKAENMINSGERYGYAHRILMTTSLEKNLEINYQDVNCK